MVDTSSAGPTPEPLTPNVNEKILLELGRITTRWGFLESIVESLLAGFLDTDPRLLFPITSDVAIGTRLKHLRLLGKLRLSSDYLVILDKLASQASVLCGYRNLIIHGLWIQTTDPEIAELMETRPTKNAYPLQMVQYVNDEYLKWLVAAITKCSIRLHDFGKQFGFFATSDKGADVVDSPNPLIV